MAFWCIKKQWYGFKDKGKGRRFLVSTDPFVHFCFVGYGAIIFQSPFSCTSQFYSFHCSFFLLNSSRSLLFLFPFFFRTSLSLFGETGLLVINPLSFLLLRRSWFPLHSWMLFSLDIDFWVGKSSLHLKNDSFHPALHGFWWEIHGHPNCLFFQIWQICSHYLKYFFQTLLFLLTYQGSKGMNVSFSVRNTKTPRALLILCSVYFSVCSNWVIPVVLSSSSLIFFSSVLTILLVSHLLTF